MSLRKWNDNGGYGRGAKGIDGSKGEDYGTQGADKGSWRAQYGRNWPDGGSVKDEYNGKTGPRASESPDYDTK